jgi:hypothetical protein
VTGYGLDDLGFESWQRQGIFSFSRNVYPASYLMGTGLGGISPVVKRLGR